MTSPKDQLFLRLIKETHKSDLTIKVKGFKQYHKWAFFHFEFKEIWFYFLELLLLITFHWWNLLNSFKHINWFKINNRDIFTFFCIFFLRKWCCILFIELYRNFEFTNCISYLCFACIFLFINPIVFSKHIRIK